MSKVRQQYKMRPTSIYFSGSMAMKKKTPQHAAASAHYLLWHFPTNLVWQKGRGFVAAETAVCSAPIAKLQKVAGRRELSGLVILPASQLENDALGWQIERALAAVSQNETVPLVILDVIDGQVVVDMAEQCAGMYRGKRCLITLTHDPLAQMIEGKLGRFCQRCANLKHQGEKNE